MEIPEGHDEQVTSTIDKMVADSGSIPSTAVFKSQGTLHDVTLAMLFYMFCIGTDTFVTEHPNIYFTGAQWRPLQEGHR